MSTEPRFRAVVREAVGLMGSQARLADAIGLSQQEVSRLCTSARTVTAETAVAIERGTSGAIPRWKLRPDLWPPPLAHEHAA